MSTRCAHRGKYEGGRRSANTPGVHVHFIPTSHHLTTPSRTDTYDSQTCPTQLSHPVSRTSPSRSQDLSRRTKSQDRARSFSPHTYTDPPGHPSRSAGTTATALPPPAPTVITTTSTTNPALAPVLTQLAGIADQLATFERQLAHIDEALANQVIAAREDVNKVTEDVATLLLTQKQTFAA